MEEARGEVYGEVFGPHIQVREVKSYGLGVYGIWKAGATLQDP